VTQQFNFIFTLHSSRR